MLELLVVVEGLGTSEASRDIILGQEHFVTFVTPMSGTPLFDFVFLVIYTWYVNKIGAVFNWILFASDQFFIIFSIFVTDDAFVSTDHAVLAYGDLCLHPELGLLWCWH